MQITLFDPSKVYNRAEHFWSICVEAVPPMTETQLCLGIQEDYIFSLSDFTSPNHNNRLEAARCCRPPRNVLPCTVFIWKPMTANAASSTISFETKLNWTLRHERYRSFPHNFSPISKRSLRPPPLLPPVLSLGDTKQRINRHLRTDTKPGCAEETCIWRTASRPAAMDISGVSIVRDTRAKSRKSQRRQLFPASCSHLRKRVPGDWVLTIKNEYESDDCCGNRQA